MQLLCKQYTNTHSHTQTRSVQAHRTKGVIWSEGRDEAYRVVGRIGVGGGNENGNANAVGGGNRDVDGDEGRTGAGTRTRVQANDGKEDGTGTGAGTGREREQGRGGNGNGDGGGDMLKKTAWERGRERGGKREQERRRKLGRE